MNFFLLLFWFLVAHSITDVFLQSEQMHKLKLPTHPAWFYWMWGHSIINGLGVYLLTGSVFWMLMESISHCLIDTGKAFHKYDVHIDQSLHLVCKIIMAYLICLK